MNLKWFWSEYNRCAFSVYIASGRRGCPLAFGLNGEYFCFVDLHNGYMRIPKHRGGWYFIKEGK